MTQSVKKFTLGPQNNPMIENTISPVSRPDIEFIKLVHTTEKT